MDLSSILGAVLNSGSNANANTNPNAAGGQQNQLLQLVLQLLMSRSSGQGGSTGLAGIIQGFQKAGLGDLINSWISTGTNQPATGSQVQAALGSDRIQQFAQETGMHGSQVTDLLAQILPQVIDRMTPHGDVPPQDDLQSTLGGLLSQLGGQR
jgi:uncharacterized protein YidB (DUF937 family)